MGIFVFLFPFQFFMLYYIFRGERIMFYGYARVSTVHQSDVSIEAQLEFLKAEADRVGEEFTPVSEKFSGTKFETRSEFSKLINKIQKGDTFGCYDTSRFGRDTGENLNYFKILAEKEVKFYCDHRYINYNSATDRMIFSTSSTYATYHRDLQMEKVSLSNVKKRKEGDTWLRGDVFGYYKIKIRKNRLIEINENQAHWIKYIFEETAKGKSVYTLAQELKDVTFPDIHRVIKDRGEIDFRLTDRFIRRLIYRPIYMGYSLKKSWKELGWTRNNRHEINTVIPITHEQLKEQLVKNVHYPPIVSEDLWWQVFDITRKSTRTHATQFEYRKSPYELTGIFRCPVCHAGYVHSTVKKGKTPHEIYTICVHNKGCEEKKYISIRKEVAEYLMRTSFFLTFLDTKHVGELLNEKKALLTQDIKDIEEQKKEIQKRIGEIDKEMDRIIDKLLNDENLNAGIKKKANLKYEELQKKKEEEEEKLKLANSLVSMKMGEFDDILKEESEDLIDNFIHEDEEGRRNIYARYCTATLTKQKLEITYTNGMRFVITTHSTFNKKDKTPFPFQMYYFEELLDTGNIYPIAQKITFDPIEETDLFTKKYNDENDKLAEKVMSLVNEAIENTSEVPRKKFNSDGKLIEDSPI